MNEAEARSVGARAGGSGVELIILAAGRGARLMPYTQDVPKCLVEIDEGTTLLSLELAEIERAGGVDGVTVVAGYRADLVEAELASSRSTLGIELVVNADYDRTNALYSLWLALQRRPREFLVLNGDTFVPASTIARLLSAPRGHEAALAFSSASTLPDDAVKVAASAGRLRAIGKELDPREADGESIGLARFVGSQAVRAHRTADALVRHGGGATSYWYTLLRQMIPGPGIQLIDCAPDEWFEVDRPSDLERARMALAGA